MLQEQSNVIHIEDLVAPNFDEVLFDILDHRHVYYVMRGGRGSTKSTFLSLAMMLLMVEQGNEDMHAICFRKTGNTLRDSVYSQVLFAIDALNLNHDFIAQTSPMKITRRSTGQTILFRGVDDKIKIKSLKAPFGYFGVTWFEEADAFASMKEIRSVLQSTMRGGEKFWVFMSYNPPETRANFINQMVLDVPDSWLVHSSDYRTVPVDWLGQQFIDDAEQLLEVNEQAYRHEYLGEVTGTGGEVFNNLRLEHLPDELVNTFDRIYMGIDWGWYPDPFHWSKMYYDTARHTLYIYDEYRAKKKSNRQTWDELQALKGVTGHDLITADSAEPKSISDYQQFGAMCRGAIKGPDSVRYSMKWLQSLRQIIIDPKRAPYTAYEFEHYEYERTGDGEVISGYPDESNHSIDAVRYALERIWRRRGL